MTDRDKRQGGRPFKPGGKKPSADKTSFAGKPGGKRPFAGKPGGKKPAPRDRAPVPTPKAQQGERIAKAMARAGACSRRDAEQWIAEGRVSVNGRALESPAFNVTAADAIMVDGRPLAARERTRLWMFHKPRGYVTTDHDPEGRETIFDFLKQRHPELPRLMTVGRLDINTEGLLLMTNDGGLARTLELPSTGWLRRYRVRAHGETDQAALDTLSNGVHVDGVDYAPIEAKLDRAQGANTWITLGLREGKNREVRRVLGHLGLEVNRLIRVSYGPFQLGELDEGAVEEVKTRVLRDQLGPTLIAQSLADFDTPEAEPDKPVRAPRPRNEHGERAPRPHRNDREPRGEKFERGDRPARGKSFDRDEEPPKRLERPAPGSRKHVSTLRAERGERLKKDRVKIERGATEDRKGRAVVVERVVAADGKAKADADTRNGRRFKAERNGDRPMRRKPQGERFERGEGRGAGEKRFGDRRPDRGGDAPRPPRRDGDAPRSRPRADRPEGGRAFEGRAPRRDDRAGGEKRFGERRPDRNGEAPRPPRRDGNAPRSRPRADRPEGGRSFEGRGAPRRDDRAGGEKRFSRDESRGKPSFKPREKREGDRKGPPRSARPGDGPHKGPPRGKPRDKR